MAGLTAPTGGDSNRIENVALIPTGFQICTLFALIDIGTQDSGQFGMKHKVRLTFEFPQHMRVFYEGNEPTPACIFINETLSMNEKANLRKKYVQPMIKKVMSDNEAEKFDISTLLGKHYVANISHSPDGKFANIESITPLDNQNMLMFGLTSPIIAQVNETQFFALDQGFDSPNFANIKGKARDLIISSQEGKTHSAKGGKFAEQAASTNGIASAPPASDLIMIDMTTTYEAFKNAGWTDEQLIAYGKAKRNVAVAPPSPAVAAPPVAAPPVSAPPSAPPVAAAPIEPPKPVLVFKDPNAQPFEKWIENGWTEQMIIEQGHASFQ